MPTDIDEAVARIHAVFERQNDEWERARGALAKLGDVHVAGAQEFFDQIDEVGRPMSRGWQGVRV